MNSLERVGNLLKEHLEETSMFGTVRTEMQNYFVIATAGDYSQRVYDCFFNLITDTTQSPASIIYLLDNYIRGLNGFSTNLSIQTLVSYPCLEALARRRPAPAVLEGPWEKVARIIVDFSPCATTLLGKGVTHFKIMDEATLKWIAEISTPELCPNPCLRLELFRLMRSFNRKEYDCALYKEFRDKVISTIFEVFESYTSLTLEQIPKFSPMDLQFVIRDNNISMGDIMRDSDLYPERINIIIAMLKLTRNLAHLEKERQLRLNSQTIVNDIWNIDFSFQLSCCLSFCGLLPPRGLILPNDNELHFEYNDCLLHFVQSVHTDPILLENVIQTLESITEISLCFPDEHTLHDRVNDEKDYVLHRFFKEQIKNLHTTKCMQEIYGGFSPATEYRLRYFQSYSTKGEQYNDSETDSEFYENVSNSGSHVSEENFSEFEVSDE